MTSIDTAFEMWMHSADAMGQAKKWAEEGGKAMSFLKGLYGVPPYSAITLMETGEGAPSAYSSPGMLFLNSSTSGKDPARACWPISSPASGSAT